MLSHLFILPLVTFLGAIVCTAASRYEDDDGFPALTGQANDYQQIVYDVDNSDNASFACAPGQVDTLWNTGGVRTHLNRAPYEANCEGGHVISRYLSSLNQTSPKIRKVVINSFNSITGLLTVSSYEYRTTSANWPPNPNKCTRIKTLWNDGGENLGQRLVELGVPLPTGFPLQNWTSYKLISFPNSEVEQQCKRSLELLQCQSNATGSYVVPAFVNVNSTNLCIRVATGQNYWATCFPVKVDAAGGEVGTVCQ
ncbi:hypothetical protein L208DRAFT_1388049 [Tricholoma matsutake]|nr:hypothetical protein L208DRAFT_1388049 [Tricholoma matsutake 945]